MSVYQLSMIGQALGQEFRNVFHYRTANPGALEGTALELLNAFNASKVNPILARVSLAYTINTLDVFDLFFPTNIAVQGTSGTGVIVGDNMGTRVAAALRTNRASRAIRRGQKRLGPLGESQQVNGVLVPTEITAWDALGLTLSLPITAGANTYVPIVVKRVKVLTPTVHYRLPITIGEYQAFDITSWTVNERIVTQNTRRLPFQ